MRRALARCLSRLSAAVVITACGAETRTLDADAGLDAGSPALPGAAAPLPGARLGGACAAAAECRLGLSCVDGTCAATGAGADGAACLTNGECGEGLTCGPAALCAAAGPGEPGAPCVEGADCRKELLCVATGALLGTCTLPEPDAGDLDAPCAAPTECLPGLSCSAVSHTCVAGSLLLNPDVFPGVSCPDEADLPFGVRSVDPTLVGEAGAPDFYATPFPSNLRRVPSGLSFSGHPVPGPGPRGFDAFAAALAQLSTADGFSRAPLIVFRATRPVAADSLAAAIRLWHLPDGVEVPLTVRLPERRGKYVCPSPIVARPAAGRLLEPGGTYVVTVTDTLQSEAGEAAVRLDDFEAWIAGETPALAPLRQLVEHGAAQSAAPEHVVGGTVFTVGHPAGLRDAVAAAALGSPAQLAEVFHCTAGARSPCAQADLPGTDCPETPLPTADEYHLRLSLPSVQRGEAPFAQAGGEVAQTPAGAVEIAGRQSVCATLLVPHGPAPAAGFPALVYAQGVSGHFRSVVAAAGALSDRFVLLGFTEPLHAERQVGASTQPPVALYLNLRNPPAAVGNAAQAQADLLAIGALLAGGRLSHVDLGEVALDPTRLAVWGHAQGGAAAVRALAGEGPFRGGVVSGVGGDVAAALLTGTAPVDGRAAGLALLHSPELDPDDPALALFGAAYEAADPRPVADAVALAAPPGTPVRHLLHVFAGADTVVPAATQALLARALGATLARPEPPPAFFTPLEAYGLPVAAPPIAGNLAGGAATVVTVEIDNDPQAAEPPGPYEAHLAVFRDPAARAAVEAFLDALRTEDVPAVR